MAEEPNKGYAIPESVQTLLWYAAIIIVVILLAYFLGRKYLAKLFPTVPAAGSSAADSQAANLANATTADASASAADPTQGAVDANLFENWFESPVSTSKILDWFSTATGRNIIDCYTAFATKKYEDILGIQGQGLLGRDQDFMQWLSSSLSDTDLATVKTQWNAKVADPKFN